MPITITVYLLAVLLTLTAVFALTLLWVNTLERRRTQQEMRRAAELRRYTQSLLDALPFPIMAKDQQGLHVLLNDALAREFGIDTNAIGKDNFDFSTQDVRHLSDETSTPAIFQDSALRAMQSDPTERLEIAYVDGEGRQRTGLWWDRPIFMEGKGAVGTAGLLLDITRFREIEKEARFTEESLRDITERMPVVLFTIHRSANQLYRLAFQAGNLEALFGISHSDMGETNDILRDWSLMERVHPEDRVRVRTLAYRAARHVRDDTLDFRAYGPDGLRWIHLAMTARRLPNGEMHWTGYLIDTTRINLQNETLRAARNAAEWASKAKADFLATMSHEIRTPMNGVVGMLELLGRTPLDSEQQELLHVVEDSAGVLLQVLNDVLEFSKLEAGSLRLDIAPFDARLLIDNIVSSMSAHIHAKGLGVRVAVDAVLAGRLRGDSVRIRQILMNLLNNAAKFTEHGSIHVALRVVGDNGDSQQLRLTVSDTGVGIPEEKQAHLFTPFSQAESWTTRRYGGTGLGLAICRHLVQLMGGTIRLDSKPGVGTTMTVDVHLPVDARHIEKPSGLDGRHAIVRLGSSQTAAVLVDYLTALGISTESIPPTRPLRAGLSANILFVEPGDEASHAAVAAQTVVVDEESVYRGGPFRQGDFIHLSANPLKWQAMVRTCAMALEPLIGPVDVPVRTDATIVSDLVEPATKKCILVAEDHPVGQALARRQLESLGWPCVIVGNGHAAYEALQDGDYIMLFTDCQMPQMDGYALASAWRAYEMEHKRTRLPIIAMSASVLDGEIDRCRAAGMDDYLSKPVQLRQLKEKIEQWMPEDLPDGKQSPPPAGNTLIAAQPALVQADMRRMMVETGRADITRIDQAIVALDAAAAARYLHRLLGALQLFCDPALLDEGHRWIADLHSELDPDALDRLPPYIDSLRQAIDKLE